MCANQLNESLTEAFDRAELQGRWQKEVQSFLTSKEGMGLTEFIEQERKTEHPIFPKTPFLALKLTPYDDVRVVILGQDPYHGANQAQGLAFSVTETVKIPPSLRNIYKELERDLGIKPANNGSLIRWAEQGVLLLNATLTVREAAAASHAKKGWEQLTDRLIQAVASKTEPLVFMLWGGYAQAKEPLILASAEKTGVKHLILKSNHPSPLSANRPPVPFIGCGHFGQTNAFLKAEGGKEVNW